MLITSKRSRKKSSPITSPVFSAKSKRLSEFWHHVPQNKLSALERYKIVARIIIKPSAQLFALSV